MSGRRHYLVCYDVSDSARLRRVHDAMVAWGEWLQHSVFLCELDTRELLELRSEVGSIINHAQDSVMIVDLGRAAGRAAPIRHLGRPVSLPASGSRII